MENYQSKLEKYADLAVRIGVNIQESQTLLINAPIKAAEFVRLLAKKAYDAGARNVHVEWDDNELSLIKYQNAPMEAFSEFPMWKAKGYVDMAKENTAFLSISCPDPDLLKDVDPEKIATYSKTSSIAMEDFMKYMESGKVSWSIVSIPSKEWAKKVFPELDENTALATLWDKIFSVTRVDSDEPVNAWREHIENLKRRLDYLNSKKYKKLHYRSSVTNITLELPDDNIWIGGGINNEKDTYFIPNIPTEEIFTMPLKQGVNGYVKSTKPLYVRGKVVKNFILNFENGKIVDFSAEEGYETLKKLIETDEGASCLGEIALVPWDSPISNSNIVFYNTLFDENASCHFALGMAYPLCIKGGTEMDKDELEKNGANTSLIHVDFMMGSQDLDIDGETETGSMEPIFRNGNWAF